MNHWMQTLAIHYRRMWDCRDNRPVIILFDIDGTILDMRYMIYNILKRFDQEHGTDHFHNITIDDIDFHEQHVTRFLDRLQLSGDRQLQFLHRYESLFLTIAASPYAYVPFNGILDVIGWFQDRPDINTGRPEMLRKDTLVSLNIIGGHKGVVFYDDLLFMKPDTWEGNIALLKAEGVKYFQQNGYRVCAFVDNEPENLKAVADMEGSEEILLLHADTIFTSDSCNMPDHAVQGKVYDIFALANTKHSPQYFTGDDWFIRHTA